MLSEHTVVFHSNYIVLIILVVMVQILQYLQFDSCLVLKFLLVSNDLDGNFFLSFVIQALDCLAKTSLAQEFEYLVPVA